MEVDESTSRPKSNVSFISSLSRTVKIESKVDKSSKSTRFTNGTLAFIFLFIVFVVIVVGLLVSLSNKSDQTENGFRTMVVNQNITTTFVPTSPPMTSVTTSEDSCGNHAWIGDGLCDDVSNLEECFFDGGDCCLETISIGTCFTCLCHLDGKLHSGDQGDSNSFEIIEDSFLFIIGDIFQIPPHVHDLKTNQIYTLPMYPYSCDQPYGFYSNHSVVVCGGANCDFWEGIPTITKHCYKLKGNTQCLKITEKVSF